MAKDYKQELAEAVLDGSEERVKSIVTAIDNKKSVRQIIDQIHSFGASLFMLAVRGQNRVIVSALIECRPDLELADDWNNTSLFYAAVIEDGNIFRTLVVSRASLVHKNHEDQDFIDYVTAKKPTVLGELYTTLDDVLEELMISNDWTILKNRLAQLGELQKSHDFPEKLNQQITKCADFVEAKERAVRDSINRQHGGRYLSF